MIFFQSTTNQSLISSIYAPFKDTVEMVFAIFMDNVRSNIPASIVTTQIFFLMIFFSYTFPFLYDHFLNLFVSFYFKWFSFEITDTKKFLPELLSASGIITLVGFLSVHIAALYDGQLLSKNIYGFDYRNFLQYGLILMIFTFIVSFTMLYVLYKKKMVFYSIGGMKMACNFFAIINPAVTIICSLLLPFPTMSITHQIASIPLSFIFSVIFNIVLINASYYLFIFFSCFFYGMLLIFVAPFEY